MSSRTALVLAALLGAAGAACTGTLTPYDPAGDDDGVASTGQAMFQTDVQPLMATCAGCHVGPAEIPPPRFLGNAGAGGFYQAIVTSPVVGGWVPQNASLLTYGAHQGVPAWTPAQADLITGWMLVEASER